MNADVVNFLEVVKTEDNALKITTREMIPFVCFYKIGNIILRSLYWHFNIRQPPSSESSPCYIIGDIIISSVE